MTDIEFVQGIALLSSAIGREMPDAQVDAWFAILGDLTPDQLRRGIVETLRRHQFAGFPPVGTILANAGAVRAVEDEALLAWASVRDAIARVGAYDSADFGPLVNAVIRDLGGWPTICDTLTADLQWVEKRFAAAYRAFAKLASVPVEMARHLPGLTEISNGRNGVGLYRLARIPLAGEQSDGIEIEQRAVSGPPNGVLKLVEGIG